MERVQTTDNSNYAQNSGSGYVGQPAKSVQLEPKTIRQFAEKVTDLAAYALFAELKTYPKPGMVSFYDNGSHQDMDAALFMKSIEALKPYFYEITIAAGMGESFRQLQQLGIWAEQEMLAATNGINTHRGAIFSLGLLCAAAGGLFAENRPSHLPKLALGRTVASKWGAEIIDQKQFTGVSHGLDIYRQFGIKGARAEAAAGFLHVYQIGLPVLRKTLKYSDFNQACVQCFFELLVQVEDTTLIHRGGLAGFRYAIARAKEFLADDGVKNKDWLSNAAQIHREFIKRRLTAGGVADLLAATVFIHHLGTE